MARVIDQPNPSLVPTRGDLAAGRLKALYRSVIFATVTLLILLLFWQTAIVALDLPSFVVPAPLSVFEALQNDWSRLSGAVGYTLQSALLGLATAFLVAVTLATLFTMSDGLARAMMPIVITIRTAPVLAIAPLLILIFGRGQATSIAVVVIVAFFPMMVNATRGFRSTNREALELMHVCGATWLQTFFKVRVPYATPHIFTGLRTAATSGLLAAMLAEWLSGAPGIGTLILEAGASRQLPLMWAGVVLTIALAFMIFALTVRIERSLNQ
ncbi:MAG: ABC transporter permease [Pseudomonadota bacterium]